MSYQTTEALIHLSGRIRHRRRELEDANKDEEMQRWLFEAESLLSDTAYFGDAPTPPDFPLPTEAHVTERGGIRAYLRTVKEWMDR